MVENIDTAYLTQVLRDAGYSAAEVIAFSTELLSGGSHGGGQIQRFRLTLADESSGPATLILKEARPTASQTLDPDFSRREIDCYQENLFAGLSHLIVPKAYRVECNPDANQYWLWLEDYQQAFSVTWTPELFASAVRAVAELHARWWNRDDELQRMPFLRYRAQAMYAGLWTERIAANVAALAGHPHERAISQVFTPDRCQLLHRLSNNASVVYNYLDRLPQTLLHQDVWLPNVGQHHDQTVLIDWSYVGRGTPGAELSQTVTQLLALWGASFDDQLLLQALYEGLTRDWRIPITFEALLAGYELTFCLRPAHILGGPLLGNILAGRPAMVGPNDLDARLASAEAIFIRIERGVQRLTQSHMSAE